jgi:hypothetical protein
MTTESERLVELLREVKQLAREYYELTEKPLGVTAEIAEYEVARILGLKLSPARQPGYDAVREISGHTELLQIKGRRLTPTSKRSQRVGGINLKHDWDVVILVLLDEHYEPTEIFEADRNAVTGAVSKPGSKARNERGSLAISQFKRIGSRIWRSQDDVENHGAVLPS